MTAQEFFAALPERADPVKTAGMRYRSRRMGKLIDARCRHLMRRVWCWGQALWRRALR